MILKKRKKYDEEPVCYCKYCLSLKVVEDEGALFCDDCGSGDTDETSIEEWEKLYEEKYGKSLINH